MKFRILPVLVLLLVVAGCRPGKIYEKHFDIDRITWNRFDVISFDVNIEDISSGYDFFIALRHHTEVPLKELTVSFTLYAPDGEMRIMEYEIPLRDSKGQLLGDGMGDLWDIRYPARRDFRFNAPGVCRVEIASAMQYADLPGIMQVGLIVQKSR